MKRFVFAALAAAALAAPAFADRTVSVQVPADLSNQVAADAYTSELLLAIKRVCRAESPLVGIGYETYRDCLVQTKADIAKQEPTGLFAARIGAETAIKLAGK